MKSKFLAGVAAIALAPASAMAVGLDRSNSDIGVLFEDGNYFELTYGRVFPEIDGNDIGVFGAASGNADSGNIAEDFSQLGAGLKLQLTDKLSMAAIAGQPFGADISYPEGPLTGGSGSFALGGTGAQLDSSELMALARYEINDNFSVHGGLRYVRLGEGSVTLSGAAYGPLNGYNVRLDEDSDLGYVVGAAYERPEIALRVALTYFSKTEHDLPTTENVTFGLPTTSDTSVETPASVNLDFQTGLNQKTLLFGQIRYAWYEDVRLSPQNFALVSDSLTDIDDNYGVSIGVGRRLTDKLSASVTLGYENDSGSSEGVSALAPTDGQKSIGLGLSYDVTDQFTIAGGLRYVDLGNARPNSGACGSAPTSPPGGCAIFEDNDVTAIGLQLGYSF